MCVNLLSKSIGVMVTVAVFAWFAAAIPAYAQCCGKHDAGRAAQPGEAGDHDQHNAPHGGKLSTVKPLAFEVVYQADEIRVYVYDPYPQARSAKGLEGEVVLKARNDRQSTGTALKFVAAPNGQQDYLAAAADLSGEKAKDLTATIKLKNLPIPHHATAEFTQPVAVQPAKPQVTVAALEKDDQAAIERQQVCPVTGAKLGSMGDPIKVLVDGKPLYLCCEGCLDKVKSDPETFLRKAHQPCDTK